MTATITDTTANPIHVAFDSTINPFTAVDVEDPLIFVNENPGYYPTGGAGTLVVTLTSPDSTDTNLGTLTEVGGHPDQGSFNRGTNTYTHVAYNGIMAASSESGESVLQHLLYTSPYYGPVAPTVDINISYIGYTLNDVSRYTVVDPHPIVLDVGTPDPPDHFSILDTTTGQTSTVPGTLYTGPVPGLADQYVTLTPDNINVTALSPNMFIHSGSGEDAIDVSKTNGTNVLDGSTGSNFLVGGTGNDTFFVDDRDPTANIWSTVVNFHQGDAATVFGITPQDFTLQWQDNQGTTGYTGLTLVATAAGKPQANLTLAGYTTADLQSGKLAVSYGTTPDLPGVPGSQYLAIHAS